MTKAGTTPLRMPPAALYLTEALPARNSAVRGIGATVIPASAKAASNVSTPAKRIDVSAKMTSLISSGPYKAASSSCLSDHSHHIGVLPKTSRSTLESTRVTGLVPARDGHDLVRGKTEPRNAHQLGKPAGLGCPV